MKKLLPLLLVLTLPAGENFNLSGFLDSCRSRGILLYAPTETDSPHGHVLLLEKSLVVTLYENTKPPASLKSGRGTRKVVGNSVLPGKLDSYKKIIQAEAKANDAPELNGEPIKGFNINPKP